MTDGKALIPRKVLFGNPDRANPQISPDGKQVSYLAADEGVLNVWVAPREDLAAARCVTHDRERGIREYFWAATSGHILYLLDKAGDENWRVYCVDLASGETRDLTPLEGVQARIEAVNPRTPAEIIVAMNDRVAELHDLYRVNIVTGERTRLYENEGFLGFTLDEDDEVRLATAMRPDGGLEIVRRAGVGWEPFISAGPADSLTTGAIGYDKAGERLYVISSAERDTAALIEYTEGGEKPRVLAEDARADVSGYLRHPTQRHIEAACITYARKRWVAIDDSVADDLRFLAERCDGEADVVSRSHDDRYWIVEDVRDNGPVTWYVYDRGADERRLVRLFSNRAALEQLTLARMHAVTIPARDGLELVSYLTLPVERDRDGRPDQPLPMVLLVHGGPWHRDEWGYDALHQWLSNRGYAVLSVNFRGSTGLGKSFTNAGNKQWSCKMHEDLLDAVEWAVGQGIAQRDKVAIYGGSYGGYATLVGLTFTPDVFACGVDIVGPSNLITLLESIPEYWKPMLDMFVDRVGDHRTEAGRAFLLQCSPLTRVEAIKRPLLIGQGANDPRVKQAESDQIVKAMQERNIPVTYVLYPDEGHGFARPENRMSFNAVAEAFLAQHMGGAYEPVGDDFAGASIEIVTGRDEVPGLA